jgi:hypothetical protein
VVAFDVVFASTLVPLVAAVYWNDITPNAGLLSCVFGGVTRVILEFTLPKVGWAPAALARHVLRRPALPPVHTQQQNKQTNKQTNNKEHKQASKQASKQARHHTRTCHNHSLPALHPPPPPSTPPPRTAAW